MYTNCKDGRWFWKQDVGRTEEAVVRDNRKLEHCFLGCWEIARKQRAGVKGGEKRKSQGWLQQAGCGDGRSTERSYPY